MNCSKCGTNYDDSFKFCPNCATQNPLVLPAPTPAVSGPQPVIQQPQAYQPPPGHGYLPEDFPTPTGQLTSESWMSRTVSWVSDFGWKQWAIVGVGILVIVGLAIGLAVGLGGGKSSTTSTDRSIVPVDNRNMTFTNENWGQVCSNPAGCEGAKVEGLVGKIFTAPEQSGSSVALQMFADPANSEQNTIVYYTGSDSGQFANGDLIKIEGTVGKQYSGQNKMGGMLIVPTISASSVAKTDANALITGGKEVIVTQQQHQNGVVIIVDKIVLRDNETDVFVRIKNNQPDKKANFYAFNAKLQVGNQQLDQDSAKQYQYGQISSEILPGVEVKGVLVFPAIGPPIPANGAVALHLEAHSENYMATFNPYVFNIAW